MSGNGSGGDMDASFFREEYSYLNVLNEIVIDIGSNLGDTSLYFCCKGAKKVISLEPYPYTFCIARNNISSSLFSDKIELINAGYGRDGTVKIDTSFIPGNGSGIKKSDKGTPVPIFSLKTLVSKYSINEGILKMDCEGCEYGILNEDIDTIRKFKMIQIEYHYGYEKLYNCLVSAGFSVRYTEPKKSFNTGASDPNMMIGFIYAEK